MLTGTVYGEHVNGKMYTFAEDNKENIYYAALSHDNVYISIAFANGVLRVVETEGMKMLARVTCPGVMTDYPMTCARWFTSLIQEKYYLVSTSSLGLVMLWSWDKSNLLLEQKCVEERNEIYSVDIDKEGKRVLTAGSDRIIRLYDNNLSLLKTLTQSIKSSGEVSLNAHLNRVFCVRFVNEQTFVSAGWDSPVNVWNMKRGRSEVELVNVQVGSDCVEAIDNSNYVIITSRETERQIRLYDYISGNELVSLSNMLSSQLIHGERLLTSRWSTTLDSIWTVTTSPYFLLLISFHTGKVLARLLLPEFPMNVICHDASAYVSCQNGIFVVATLHK